MWIQTHDIDKSATQNLSVNITIDSNRGSGAPPNNSINPYFDYPSESWAEFFPYLSTSTPSSTFKQRHLPTKVQNNFQRLKDIFDKERAKLKTFDDNKDDLFLQVALPIAELPFSKSAVEITSSDSIKISMTFANNLLVIVSKPFEVLDNVSKDDIIFSLFRNRKMIASNVSKTTDFVEGFKRFLLL